MKQIAMIATLMVANFAQANVLKTYTGVNNIDKSPCTIQVIKTAKGTEVKVAVKVQLSERTYGEPTVYFSPAKLELKNENSVQKDIIYKSIKSELKLQGIGFTYSAKSKYRGYEGTFNALAKADLNLAKGTFDYQSNTKIFFKTTSLIRLNPFPDATSVEKASCYKVK